MIITYLDTYFFRCRRALRVRLILELDQLQSSWLLHWPSPNFVPLVLDFNLIIIDLRHFSSDSN